MSSAAPSLDLAGRRILVTGASGALGGATASLAAAAGAELVLHARSGKERVEALQEGIRSRGGTATVLFANLARPEEIRELFAAVEGPLHGFVHAASLGSFKPLVELRPNQWDLAFAVDPRAFLFCAREAAERMEPGGSLVACSSPGARAAIPSYGAIGPAKGAVEALVRGLAAELGARGLRVNAVSAGPLEPSPVTLHPDWLELRSAILARTPAGRIGTPEDAARVVLFLLSPLAGWISGQVVTADGGLGATL